MSDEEVKHGPSRSRKDRPTGTVHFGDVDFETEDQIGDATWGEVATACCSHSGEEWGMILVGVLLICFFLYFFLLGLDLLGNSAKVVGGCSAGSLFGDDQNPVAGVMIGILATVLLQSSSTTTSIVVSLVPEIIQVEAGIFMIMGANIGTSVTNTIVALGSLGDGAQLERAFSAAVVHDMFNFLTVAVLFPIELVTHWLAAVTAALVKNAAVGRGEKWEGPVKKLVGPLGKTIIIANKDLIKDVAAGDQCEDFYPINCTSGASYESCGKAGLISCNKKTDACPLFFSPTATQEDDVVSGAVCLFLSIVLLFICLGGLVFCLQKIFLGMSTRIVYKATNVNGFVAILIGVGITIIVQSSSITTSALTPLCGVGILRLEQMLPLTLGANIGTTITAIIAALVKDEKEPFQVALAHLLFNITGILIWYPIPVMRKVPLAAARALGKLTRMWKGFPLLYIAIVFFLIPAMFLGISSLFEQGQVGLTILGVVIVLALVLFIGYAVYKMKFAGGKEQAIEMFEKYEKKRTTMATLPEDMESMKSQIQALIDHTGLPVEGEDDEDDVEEAPEKEKNDKEDEISA